MRVPLTSPSRRSKPAACACICWQPRTRTHMHAHARAAHARTSGTHLPVSEVRAHLHTRTCTLTHARTISAVPPQSARGICLREFAPQGKKRRSCGEDPCRRYARTYGRTHACTNARTCPPIRTTQTSKQTNKQTHKHGQMQADSCGGPQVPSESLRKNLGRIRLDHLALLSQQLPSRVPGQMWEGAGPVPVQMWHGRAQSWGRCGPRAGAFGFGSGRRQHRAVYWDRPCGDGQHCGCTWYATGKVGCCSEHKRALKRWMGSAGQWCESVRSGLIGSAPRCVATWCAVLQRCAVMQNGVRRCTMLYWTCSISSAVRCATSARTLRRNASACSALRTILFCIGPPGPGPVPAQMWKG